MADTLTTNLSLTKPEVDVEDLAEDWGEKLNDNLDDIDDKWTSVTPSAIGTVAAGSSLRVARADHVHPLPTNDDITLAGAGKGLVVTTPDGAHTYRIAISNNGELTTEQLT